MNNTLEITSEELEIIKAAVSLIHKNISDSSSETNQISDEDKIYVQNIEKLMDKLNMKYNSQIF